MTKPAAAYVRDAMCRGYGKKKRKKRRERERGTNARACMRFSPRRSIRLAHRNVSFPRSLVRMERHQFSTVYRSRHGKVPVTRLPGGTLSVLLPPSLSLFPSICSVCRRRGLGDSHACTSSYYERWKARRGIEDGGRISARGIACHHEQP